MSEENLYEWEDYDSEDVMSVMGVISGEGVIIIVIGVLIVMGVMSGVGVIIVVGVDGAATYLLRILPTGVVSKNDTGAARTRVSRPRCIPLEALTPS